MGVRCVQQIALVVVELTVTGEQPSPQRAFDAEWSDRDKAPCIADEDSFHVLDTVDRKRANGAVDETHHVAILGRQVKQRLERVAVVSQERANQLEAAWSGSQRLRTACQTSSEWQR